jgi:hypothetical protein
MSAKMAIVKRDQTDDRGLHLPPPLYCGSRVSARCVECCAAAWLSSRDSQDTFVRLQVMVARLL